jgi:putative membrane protein
MMFYGHGFGGGDWLMLLLMFLFWGGLITLVIWGLRALFATAQPGQSPAPTRSPLDMAKERFARGDISREEFTEITHTLKESNQ